jgi:hypothetical protein
MRTKKNTVEQKIEKEVKEKVVPQTLQNLTRGELLTRYKANVVERKRLAEENKVIGGLYKSKKSEETKANAEAKIAALQAKLEALKNPSQKMKK